MENHSAGKMVAALDVTMVGSTVVPTVLEKEQMMGALQADVRADLMVGQ